MGGVKMINSKSSDETSRRGFLRLGAEAAASAALALTGINCGSTAEYDKPMVNSGQRRLMERVSKPLFEPDKIPSRRENQLLLEGELDRIADYADELPPVDVNIYYAKPYLGRPYLGDITPERLNLRVTNRLPSVSKLKNLEDALPASSRARLVMGKPDSDLPTRLVRNHQLSRRCGLYDAESYGNQEFSIDVERVTGVVGGKDTDRYHVRITYGVPAFKAVQTVKDDLSVLETAENTLVAFAGVPITNRYIVPLEALLEKGFDHLFAYVLTNNNPPDGMGYIDNVVSDGRGDRENNVISTLRNVQETQAENLIVFNYKGGTSVLYLGGNVTNIAARDQGIEFTTEEAGISHLLSFLYRLGRTATRYPPEKIVREREYLLAPTSGGGDEGSPGGIGWGGGDTGGAGGGIR